MRVSGRLGRALASLGVLVGFVGVASASAAAQTQGVTIEAVTIDQPTFDVTNADVWVQVDVGLRSDQYITGYHQIAFDSRDSTQKAASLVPSTRTDANGLQTFHFSVPFTKGAASGPWDLAFGGVYYGTEWVTLAAPTGQPSSVSVTSQNADLDPPVLQSLTVDPGSVSTGYRSDFAKVVAHVTDVSGVTGVGAYFHTESDSDRVPLDFELTSGTAQDGIYEASAMFLQDAPAGTWPLLIGIQDVHGNFVPLGSPPVGMPQSITVTHDPESPPMPQFPEGHGGDRRVTVTWQPPVNDGGSALTGYVATLLPERRQVQVGPLTLSATFDALGDGEQHTVSVAAVNAMGVGPEAVNYNPVYTWKLPDAPTAVTATAGDASASVTWTPPSWNGTSVSEYVVTASPGGAETRVSAVSRTATISGLTNRTAYTFTVSAVNAAGRGPESGPSTAVTPYSKPAAPVLTATARGDGIVDLTWQPLPDTGLPITRYIVVRSDGAGTIQASYGPSTGSTSYRVSQLPGGRDYSFTLSAFNAMGHSVSAPVRVTTPPSAGAYFTPNVPKRVLDTRYGVGAARGPVLAGRTVTFTVPGLAPGTRSVTLNLTGTGATRATYVTAYAAGSPRPSTSNLNLVPGTTTATHATVPVSADGRVTLYNSAGSVQLVADVAGSFAASSTGSAFVPLSPNRVLDTRTGLGVVAPAKLGPGKELVLKLPRMPSAARAAVLNVTAVGATAATYVTAYPGGATRPTASNLNVGNVRPVANLVTVQVGTDGTVRLFNAYGSVDLVVDLEGYYLSDTGSAYATLPPTRVLDTRTGLGGPRGQVGATPRRLVVPGLPAGATAVALAVTETGPRSSGFLTVWPGDAVQPGTSTLNFVGGQTVSNQVLVPVAADGSVMLAVHGGPADLVVDVAGAFVP